jgi:hypothetical protein
MPFSTAAIRAALLPFCLITALAGCSKAGTEGSNAVAMKDLEVVDGTATDAMTDLDGVRTEGTASAPAANATAARAAEPASNAAKAPDSSEVISDQ